MHKSRNLKLEPINNGGALSIYSNFEVARRMDKMVYYFLIVENKVMWRACKWGLFTKVEMHLRYSPLMPPTHMHLSSFKYIFLQQSFFQKMAY